MALVLGQKIALTEEELGLKITELMKKFGFSKATACRARQRGYYFQDHQNSNSRKTQIILDQPKTSSVGEVVYLSPGERKLSSRVLARRLGIGKTLASKAIKLGYFKVPGLKVYESPPEWKAAHSQSYNPESVSFRVNLAPAELSYSVERLVELYSHLGLSQSQAYCARRSGYFCPNLGRPREIVIDEVAFELYAEECMKSAQDGAKSALQTMLGSEYSKKLKGVTLEDVASAALDRLRELSGREEIVFEKWRLVVARYASLRFLGDHFETQKKEAITIDQMEGRFEED